MNFGLKNGAHRASLGGHDVRAEKSFPDWGLMSDFDTCSQNYARFTAIATILPQLCPVLPILTIFALIFSFKIF